MSKKDNKIKGSTVDGHEEADAEVLITFEKKSGETTFSRSIKASNAREALNGLELLIIGFSREVGLKLEEVISLMAVDLLGPARKQNTGGFTVHREMEERI